MYWGDDIMKLNYKRTILIGLAFMSICSFWQFYDNEIPKILKYTFVLSVSRYIEYASLLLQNKEMSMKKN